MARRRSRAERLLDLKPWASLICRSTIGRTPALRSAASYFPDYGWPAARRVTMIDDARRKHRLFGPAYAEALAALSVHNFDAFDPDEASCGPDETRFVAAEIGNVCIPGHILRPVDLDTGRQVLLGHRGLAHWGEAYPGLSRLKDVIVDGPCISLPPYTHYGHMLTDILAPIAEGLRIGALSQGKALTVVLPQNVRPFVSAFVDGLSRHGIALKMISIGATERVIARRYLYLRTHCPNRERIYGTPDTGPVLRSLFAETYGAGMASYGSRVYLKRTGAKARGVDGEAALIERLTGYGFRVLEADWNNHADQVDAFSNADVVVGVHGAGLSNVIFCRPGAKVFEILAGDWRKTTVLHWAAEAGLDYEPIIGTDEQKLQAFSIDPFRVEAQIMAGIAGR